MSTGINRAATNARRLLITATVATLCVLTIALAVLTYKMSHPAAPKVAEEIKADLSPPINLVSTNATAVSAALSWTPPPGDEGIVAYDIYNGSTLAVSVTGTAGIVTGLSPNTSYVFKVVSKNAAGETSPASNPVTVMTPAASADTAAPTAPSNLTVNELKATSATLSWTASTDNIGVTAYDIYNGSVLLTSVTGSPPNTTATIDGLTPGTSYAFTVKAKDAAGNVSDPSEELATTTSTTIAATGDPAALVAALAAPSDLSATTVTTDSVELTWTAPAGVSDVAGYDIYEGSNVTSTATGTKATVANLTPGTAYNFTVKAKDAKGNTSGASNPVSVTTHKS